MEKEANIRLALVGMNVEEELDIFAYRIYSGTNLQEKSLQELSPKSEATSFQDPTGVSEEGKPDILPLLNRLAGSLRNVEPQTGGRVAVILVAPIGLISPSDVLSSETSRNTLPEFFCNNTLVNYITEPWSFRGLCHLLTDAETHPFKALEVARMLLATERVDAVVVGTTSAAVVLRSYAQAKENGERIYATIEAVSLRQQPSNSLQVPTVEAVVETCQQAFSEADVNSAAINYLEIFTPNPENMVEIHGLSLAYQTSAPGLHCTLSSSSSVRPVGALTALIKTALCLYHRYIPCTLGWSAPAQPVVWQRSPFYVTTESRPWLTNGSQVRRAAINALGFGGSTAHVILAEEPKAMGRVNPFLAQIPFYLLPLVAWDLPSLHEGLEKLRQVLEQGVNLSVLVRRYYTASQEQSQAPYILALVGHNHKELLHEVQRAFKGVGDAFNRKQEWKTPLGSYFTTNPLGPKGSIAFMYPGAFNSYPGLGKDLFTLFPACHDRLERFSSNPSLMVREQQLYPRSLEPITQRLLEFWEARLNEDMVAMMESGVSFAVLHTTILREYFRITPQAAFGYSLGETSMLYALGVWGSWESSYSNLRTSELFRTGLAGPKNLPRSLWGLPPSQEPAGEDFWSTYVLMAPAQLVRKRLRSETQVYLTHINTPEEVVIAGAGEACLKVIKDLGCEYFRSPASHVVHCTPVEPAYPELLNLCTQPVEAVLDIRFYCCASEEAPISLTNEALAPAIAQGICQFVDFPQLIERVWADGARIFIELGPGSTCSRWTSETLKGRDHLAVSINKRGTDDHTALVQLLAKLLSHRVALDLSLLYSTATEPPLKLSRTSVEPVPVPAPNPSRPPSLENLPPTTVSPSLPEQPQTELVKESAKADPVATPKMYILASQLLQEHAALVTRSHGIYLRERLKALHHLNELIRQQMFFAHKLVNQETQGEDQGQYDSENTDLTLQPSKRTREEKNQAPASSF